MLYSKIMKSLLLHKAKDFKGKVAQQELRRAHLIIALLAISLAFIIMLTALYPLQLDPSLSAIAAALLIIVSGTSLSIALAIRPK